MATKKALVLTNGQIEQIQAGDTLEGITSSSDDASLTNGGGAAAPIGSPVYISSAGTFQLARANASGTKDVFGLVVDTSIAASGSGSVRKDGTLAATTTQWDAVTGQTGGLTPNARYFLSEATAGRLTTTAPSSGWVAPVGLAFSTTEMDIHLGTIVKL